MKLSNYYFYGVVLPGIVSIVGMIVISIWINQGYKSEWITEEFAIGMDLFVSIVIFGFHSIIGLSIFLNSINKIRDQKLLNAAFWLIPNLSFAILTAAFFNDSHIFYLDWQEILYILILSLPYIFGIVLSFIFFRYHASKFNSGDKNAD